MVSTVDGLQEEEEKRRAQAMHVVQDMQAQALWDAIAGQVQIFVRTVAYSCHVMNELN